MVHSSSFVFQGAANEKHLTSASRIIERGLLRHHALTAKHSAYSEILQDDDRSSSHIDQRCICSENDPFGCRSRNIDCSPPLESEQRDDHRCDDELRGYDKKTRSDDKNNTHACLIFPAGSGRPARSRPNRASTRGPSALGPGLR